ncbi:hypothetical protein KL928_004692 [Ogataea angusta]|uniref:Uncharacterized protein n=1 Tax=Pichia angusta TaxID=870730 RepID=A0AAN6DBP6_PICAN|nr:uncharacterized protein KL928_004692 [Ogataea angusta]KAG7816650.1 hypothetical protein KL928_004692 [Ogataea angusta]
MDRGDKNHPEPEPQQKRDEHQRVVLEQAAEACGVPSARKHTPFAVEVAYLGGQVVKRVEPRTLENQKHRAQRQNEHVSGRVVAACPPALDGSALRRGQRAGIIEIKAGGVHESEFLRVGGPCLRNIIARAASQNEDLVHDRQAKKPLRIEEPAESHACKLFEGASQRVRTKIARRAGHSEQQQNVHSRRPEPPLLDEKDVEDVSFRGEVVVRRFPGRSKPDQLAE